MQPNCHRSWIEINLDQLIQNIRIIKNFIYPQKFCLPIKSNAYGHGSVQIASIAEKERVDYLAVASLSEGIFLREHNIKLPILILGSFQKEEVEACLAYDLEITVSSEYKVKLIEEALLNTGKKAAVHLKVDTGMRRVGARPETALRIFEQIKSSSTMILKGVYSHLANADDKDHVFNEIQEEAFQRFLEKIPQDDLLIHFSSSSALQMRKWPYENMVRIGILTYGIKCKFAPLWTKEIKSIFSLKSKISYFKVIEKGDGVSYGHTYIAKKRTRLVTVPIGYGDGYLRALSNKGEVLIRGKRYPIVGAICMDQLMVDIGQDEAYVGDEVVLIGKQSEQEITVEDVAELAQTISYEIFCHLNQRLLRVYHLNEAREFIFS